MSRRFGLISGNRLVTCVACGGNINQEGLPNHHCDERKEKLRNSIMKRGRDWQEPKTYWAKLRDGFEMLSQSGDMA